MSTAAGYPHLNVENGTARVAGTRYTVIHLAAEHYHYGWTAEENCCVNIRTCVSSTK